MAQTAVCNRHHAVDKQLCRWLLLSLDRLPGNELTMTRELRLPTCSAFGAKASPRRRASCRMPGSSATTAAALPVIDRAKLESRVCECYRVVKREFARLLPRTPPS